MKSRPQSVTPEPVESGVLYEPVSQEAAQIALEEAMLDLQEQLEDDDDIVNGMYLFRISRCEPIKTKEEAQEQAGSLAIKNSFIKARVSNTNIPSQLALKQ